MAARAANYPRVANALGGGSIPLNMAGGAGSGLATEEAGRFQRSQGLLPEESGSLAPLVAPVAGMLIGGGIGGAYQTGRDVAQWATGNTPFLRTVRELGADLQAGLPLTSTAGNDLRTMVQAMGHPASGLDTAQYNSIAGRRVSPNAAYRASLEPEVAPILRSNFPDQMDDIAAAHIANAQTRGSWNNLHPRTREALIPDPGNRNVVDETFRGGVVPSQSFTENLSIADRLRSLREASHVGSLVNMEALFHSAGALHADPSIAGAAAILGYAIPYGARLLNWSLTSPAGRQAAIGGAIGVPQGASVLQPGGMQYTAPPDFAPPQR
jgi:hypothetical protein